MGGATPAAAGTKAHKKGHHHDAQSLIRAQLFRIWGVRVNQLNAHFIDQILYPLNGFCRFS